MTSIFYPVTRNGRTDTCYCVRHETDGHPTGFFACYFEGEKFNETTYYSTAVMLCTSHRLIQSGAVVIEAID